MKIAMQVHVQSEADFGLGQVAEREHQQTLQLPVIDIAAHAGYFDCQWLAGRPAAWCFDREPANHSKWQE